MGILRRKSKEEKEIEREIRYRKAKGAVQNYIERLNRLQRMVFEQGKEAAKLGEERFLRRQAAKYLALEERIKRGKRMLLLMEEAKIQREMVKVGGEFVKFARDITESIAEGPDIKEVSRMQVEFEKAMSQAEALDEALAVTMDMTSESILTGGEFSEESVSQISKLMESEAEAIEEKQLDERISKGIKEIEERMRGG